MYDRVEQHFAVLRAAVDDGGGEVFATMGDGIAAAFTSVDGARAGGGRRPARRCPSIGLAVRMGIHTGEVERVGDDFRGRAVNRAARIMAVGHGGQILLSDVSAALVRDRAPAALDARRPRHAPAPRPRPSRSACGRSSTPTCGQQFPPVRGVDTYSNNLPAQRSSLVGRDCDVQRARRHDAAAPHRDAHRRRRRRQDPPRRPRRGRPAVASSPPCGSSSWPASPTPTTSPTPSPVRVGACRRGRPAGGGHRVAGRGTDACSSSTTASTSSTAWPSAIDVLTAACPELSDRGDQS